jgi:hypothetical protein
MLAPVAPTYRRWGRGGESVFQGVPEGVPPAVREGSQADAGARPATGRKPRPGSFRLFPRTTLRRGLIGARER